MKLERRRRAVLAAPVVPLCQGPRARAGAHLLQPAPHQGDDGGVQPLHELRLALHRVRVEEVAVVRPLGNPDTKEALRLVQVARDASRSPPVEVAAGEEDARALCLQPCLIEAPELLEHQRLRRHAEASGAVVPQPLHRPGPGREHPARAEADVLHGEGAGLVVPHLAIAARAAARPVAAARRGVRAGGQLRREVQAGPRVRGAPRRPGQVRLLGGTTCLTLLV